MSIQIAATKTAIRTRGDGPWKKFTYQDINFSITLSGLLKFDDENFTGWDLMNTQMGFTQVLCRITFDDQNGDVRTVQGNVMVETSTLSYSPSALVKDDFSLQGSGSLIIFDGLIPCPSEIISITVDGQEAADGTISVSYTYTGDVYQVKYRIDDTGDYVYALVGASLIIPGLSVNQHSIEIIPVCSNGYEGTGTTQAFVVTQALVCNTTITTVNIGSPSVGQITSSDSLATVINGTSGAYISPVLSGPATIFAYAFDGGTQQFAPVGAQISIAGLNPGVHTVYIGPICAINGQNVYSVWGATIQFTVNSQASQSQIAYSYTNDPAGNSMSIYVNGVQVFAGGTANDSGSFAAPVGATIRAVLGSRTPSRTGTLRVINTTTSVTLYNQSANSPFTLSYSFVADGSSFNISGIVSP